MLFFATVAAIMESIGLLVFVPIFELLDDGASRYLSFQFLQYNVQIGIVKLFVIVASLFTFKGIFTYFALSYIAKLKGEYLYLLKGGLVTSISQMTYEGYLNTSSGNLVNLINEQCNKSILALGFSLDFVARFAAIIVYLAASVYLSASTTFIVCISGFFIFLIFRSLNIKVHKISAEAAKKNGETAIITVEAIQSFKYLLATNQVAPIFSRMMRRFSVLGYYQTKLGKASGIAQSAKEPLAALLLIFLIGAQTIFMGVKVSEILVTLALFYKMINSLLGLQVILQNALSNISSQELVVREIENLNKVQQQIVVGEISKIVINFEDKLLLSEVFYQLEEDAVPLLQDINLEISKNEIIGIVGESGSGKTTLANILAGIIKPSKGSIEIDGTPIANNHYASWGDSIGYVSQESTLFNGTVLQNITMEFDDGSSNLSSDVLGSVYEAAERASVHDFIISLKEGYLTQVGERGINLSGGQRQRILIARELFRRPKFLIFDEATSALDSAVETEIKQSIIGLKGRVTIVIIAHGSSMIEIADKVIVLKSGKIVEQGNVAALTQDSATELYRLMCNAG